MNMETPLTYPPHPLAEIFPMKGESELEAFAYEILENGQHEPIILLDGQILDGRRRYLACQLAGVAPHFIDWTAELGTPQAIVVSRNMRKDLNESQRALVAAKLCTTKSGQRVDFARRREAEGGPAAFSIADATLLLKISRDLVAQGKRVLAQGLPEEIAAIERGAASASTVGDRIRLRIPDAEKQKRKALSQTGRNPERFQRQQMNAQMWAHVREGLIHLTSLPRVEDVVPVVRRMDRAGLTDQKLAAALGWLKEFADAYSSSS